MIFVLAFLGSFGYIALKSIQQRLVMLDDWLWVMPMSMGIAYCEVYVIANIAKMGFSLDLVHTIGLGSGCGALAGMYLHKKLRLKGKGVKPS